VSRRKISLSSRNNIYALDGTFNKSVKKKNVRIKLMVTKVKHEM